MAKSVLAIDIDEVLFPLVPEIAAYHNTHHGTNLKVDDFVTYDLEKVWGGTVAEAVAKVNAFFAVGNIQIEPIDGAIENLKRLADSYRLVVITSRHDSLTDATHAWLDRHFAGVFETVILAGNHYAGGDVKTKVSLCREMGAVALIDDSLRYVKECSNVGQRAILFGDYPWNQADDLPAGIVRAQDWDEVRNLLMEGNYETN
jgi:5'(3')-deoxyribonucleotidase